MGLGSAKVIFNERDLSQYISQVLKGVVCLQGVCERGPINDPQRISSWPEYQRAFGNMLPGHDFPFIAQRLLNRGGVIWVNRIEHHTDISDADSCEADLATAGDISDRGGGSPGQDSIRIDAHDAGLWGNSVTVEVSDGTLKPDDEFNLTVRYSGQSNMDEYFENLSMNPTARNYVVNKVNHTSHLIKVTDLESSNDAPHDRPANGTYEFSGGSDAIGDLAHADYIGDEGAMTGFHAFNDIDDSMYLATPDNTDIEVAGAGIAYCENRADMIYFVETPENVGPQLAVDWRLGQSPYTHAAFNSSYGAMYFGRPLVYDQLLDYNRHISNLGDALGVHVRTDHDAKEWYAAAGINRGKVPNVIGLDFNTGTRARQGLLDYLATNQINPLVIFPREGMTVWGQSTLLRETSALQDLHIRKLLIFMRKLLVPVARFTLFEPNDPISWRQMFRRIDPWLRELKSQRAFYDYKYEGDQYVNSIEEAQVNSLAGIERGEYRVRIFIKPTKIVKWLMLDVVLTSTTATFEEVFDEVRF